MSSWRAGRRRVRAKICSHFRGAHEAPARRRLAAGVGVDRFAPRPRSLLNPRMMLTVATRAIPFFPPRPRRWRRCRPCISAAGERKDPWWRDPETGGVNGVARRSLVAAAAQVAFAALAIGAQRQFETWRTADWGEAAWRGDDGIEGSDSRFRARWRAEAQGWRVRAGSDER